MKKWSIRIALGLFVLLLLVGIGAFLFMNSIVKTGFETVGPKITKVDMRLGAANISPFSQSCQLNDLFIGNPEGFKTPAAIKVGEIKVAVKLQSMLSDVIEVDEVRIIAPEITLEAGLTGSNLGKILDNLNSFSAPEEKKSDQPASKSEKNIYIKNLVISDGKINASFTALGGKALPVAMPPLHLENIGSKEKGVSIAEATSRIMQSILASSTKAAEGATAGIGTGLKEVGTGAKGGATKAFQSVKGLFK